MKAWATQADELSGESAGRFRALMRKWWEENKAAFERADYGAVKPTME